MDSKQILNYEVNFLTEEDVLSSDSAISAIKAEFDLIQLWQGMIRPFGFQARAMLDCLIALSLRKLLCDDNSLLLSVCSSFKMPPLSGKRFDCPGDDNSMKLVIINTDVYMAPYDKWIPLNSWLNETIAWIEKDANSIPEAYTDWFYKMLERKLNKSDFKDYYQCELCDGNKIWKIKEPSKNKQKVYDLLKKHDYYDLTIGRMLKHIADKRGAHKDNRMSFWIRQANSSIAGDSAVSVFASQMIYAATKQVKQLEDYRFVSFVTEKECEIRND